MKITKLFLTGMFALGSPALASEVEGQFTPDQAVPTQAAFSVEKDNSCLGERESENKASKEEALFYRGSLGYRDF